MPGAPVNGDASLDIDVYCKGYVAWDFMAMFIQVEIRDARLGCYLTTCHYSSVGRAVGQSSTALLMILS